tara:strand:+ start:95 stop:442 length:348 start_codon:yes stop_codon:yes gene_type:complete
MKPNSSYADQRRDRLSEVIGDYLSDGTMSAKDIYNEIVSEVQSYIDYYQNELNKSIKFRELIREKVDVPKQKDLYKEICLNERISEASPKDWEDFWESKDPVEHSSYYYAWDRNR